MTIGTKPPADVVVDRLLVQALLHEQHPDLAHLVPVKVAEGWDNALFRLGDELAVRLPRRAASAVLIEHEQRWLPQLSARLPVPVPVPVRVGVPSPMFGWALALGLAFLAHSRDDAAMASLGHRTIKAALNEP